MTDSTDWIEVEKFLEKKEREDLLAKDGIILPPDHMKGYKHTPKVNIVQQCPWDVTPVPPTAPTCRSDSWIHKDVMFEIGSGIAYITLNRPQANNAINDRVIEALNDACCELHKRSDVRVVVLRSEGKMFCAGSEPSSYQEALAVSDTDSRRATATFIKLLYWFQSLPQFVIGLAHGSSMGTGIGLLACCDVAFAVKTARFTVNDVQLGSCPATIAAFVTQKVGQTNAIRMLCTAENLSADDCMKMGLLNDVVEDASKFSALVSDLCDKITLCAPMASSRCKRLAQSVSCQPIASNVMDFTAGELSFVAGSPETFAGFSAVLAKTKPSWANTTIKPFR